jgi:hypothetical protein
MESQTGEPINNADRRSALRQNCRIDTLIVEHASAGSHTAIVQDLSREGFRLLLPVSLPCGDEVLLHPPAGYELLKIRGSIVRQRIAVHEGRRMIECGVEVADTAAWRKHVWFLTLRTGSEEYEAAKQKSAESAAA